MAMYISDEEYNELRDEEISRALELLEERSDDIRNDTDYASLRTAIMMNAPDLKELTIWIEDMIARDNNEIWID